MKSIANCLLSVMLLLSLLMGSVCVGTQSALCESAPTVTVTGNQGANLKAAAETTGTKESDAYEIQFSPKGASGSMQPFTAKPGTINIPKNQFQNDGYAFDGWFACIRSSNETRDGKYVYKKGNSYALFVSDQADPGWDPAIFVDNQRIPQFAKAGETLIFVARWKPLLGPDEYAIQFDPEGATGSMPSFAAKPGTINIPSYQFQKDGFAFDGWLAYIRSSNETRNEKYVYHKDNSYALFTSKQAGPGWNQAVFVDNQPIPQLAQAGETLVFVARWKQLLGSGEYTISFNPKGATGSMQPFTAGPGTINIPKNQFQKDGFVFDGWFAHIHSSNETRNEKYVYHKDNSYALFASNQADPGWISAVFVDNQQIPQLAQAGETLIFAARWKSIKLEQLAKERGIELPPSPWHLMDVRGNFEHEVQDFRRIDMDIVVSGDVSSDYNLYIAPLYASINDQAFYLGMQTNIMGQPSQDDVRKVPLGRGGIFSRWSSDPATPIGLEYVDKFEDGFGNSADYEGQFCNVLRPFEWSEGRYTMSLIKEESVQLHETTHTWVAFEITNIETKEVRRIGRLLFKGDALALGDQYYSFVEIYGSKKSVPKFDVSFGPLRVDGAEVTTNVLFASCPITSVNVATVSAVGRNVVVSVDPNNLALQPSSALVQQITLDQ